MWQPTTVMVMVGWRQAYTLTGVIQKCSKVAVIYELGSQYVANDIKGVSTKGTFGNVFFLVYVAFCFYLMFHSTFRIILLWNMIVMMR